MDTQQPKGGPKTADGKAITRLNAVSHGLLSREVLLEGEDGEKLKALTQSMHDEFTPIGELEAFLIERLIVDMWRLRRALAVERVNSSLARQRASQTLLTEYVYGSEEALGLLQETAVITDADSDKIMRYATNIERSLHRNLHELQRIQSARNGGRGILPAVVDVNADGFDQDD